jgi:hypothetical protein
MTTNKLFHELLGLGLNWEVVDSRFERERSTLVLEIRETKELWNQQRCPKDGGRVTCYDHIQMVTWRHLKAFQHSCEIQSPLPRRKCDTCGHVYRVNGA